MLYWEIIDVCSEIHTKHTTTMCGQNVELLNIKPGGTHSDYLDLGSQNVSELQSIAYVLMKDEGSLPEHIVKARTNGGSRYHMNPFSQRQNQKI